jgi:hypothetical protein
MKTKLASLPGSPSARFLGSRPPPPLPAHPLLRSSVCPTLRALSAQADIGPRRTGTACLPAARTGLPCAAPGGSPPPPLTLPTNRRPGSGAMASQSAGRDYVRSDDDGRMLNWSSIAHSSSSPPGAAIGSGKTNTRDAGGWLLK